MRHDHRRVRGPEFATQFLNRGIATGKLRVSRQYFRANGRLRRACRSFAWARGSSRQCQRAAPSGLRSSMLAARGASANAPAMHTRSVAACSRENREADTDTVEQRTPAGVCSLYRPASGLVVRRSRQRLRRIACALRGTIYHQRPARGCVRAPSCAS